eukprot:3940628-Rhodomonas_salina.1
MLTYKGSGAVAKQPSSPLLLNLLAQVPACLLSSYTMSGTAIANAVILLRHVLYFHSGYCDSVCLLSCYGNGWYCESICLHTCYALCTVRYCDNVQQYRATQRPVLRQRIPVPCYVCYAESGTEIAYAATSTEEEEGQEEGRKKERGREGGGWRRSPASSSQVTCAMRLRACYAAPGTDLPYAATSRGRGDGTRRGCAPSYCPMRCPV